MLFMLPGQSNASIKFISSFIIFSLKNNNNNENMNNNKNNNNKNKMFPLFNKGKKISEL